MKKVIINSIILLAMSFSLVTAHALSKGEASQSLEPAISSFASASRDLDIEKILDSTYPKVFEVVPREQLSQALTSALKSEAAPKITGFTVSEDKTVEAFSGGFYSILNSDTSMVMNGFPDADTNKQMQSALEAQGLTVGFDEKNTTFNLSKKSKIIAINEGQGWKFVDFDQAVNFGQGFLPEEIYAALQK